MLKDFTNESGISNPTGVTGYLWTQFGLNGLGTQATLLSPTVSIANKELALVQALNLIINGPLIYNTTLFASIALSSTTSSLLSSYTAAQLPLLNRMLLQDALRAGSATVPRMPPRFNAFSLRSAYRSTAG